MERPNISIRFRDKTQSIIFLIEYTDLVLGIHKDHNIPDNGKTII